VTPRGLRERPAAVIGLGLALGLVLTLLAPPATTARAGPAAENPRAPRVPTIYHKSRSFRIPFNIEKADRPRLKEVQLWVSEDTGYTWKPVSVTTPDRPAFTFRAPRDAEYWFAVRTVDTKGLLFPGEDESVAASMKVIVDTIPPRLVIEPDGRRGSLAALRWDVRDEHLDLKSLVVEYQVEGGRDWRQVPIRRILLGEVNWDAGTAAPLKVRASVEDKAHNVTEAVVTLPEGTPANPGVASNDPADLPSPPPVSQISTGPSFPPADDAPGGGAPSSASASASASPAFPFPFPSSERPATPSGASPGPTGLDLPPFAGGPEPAGGNGPESPADPRPAANANAPSPAQSPGPGGAQSLLVPKPQFPLRYEVEDGGPNGPATVELWVTQDGGRTWFPKGTDNDSVSPFPVDLGGEGTFGLRLVALAASGLGDKRPGPGDPPELLVEVDGTPPTVQILPTKVWAGPNLGKVDVRWRASDPHMPAKSVVLSWRPEQPGAPWQPITPEPIPNTGSYTWNVPPTVPPRFHLRVDVVDSANNRGWAETTEGPPVYVDRTRPRSRIIGLDPSARTGTGPSTRAVR